ESAVPARVFDIAAGGVDRGAAVLWPFRPRGTRAKVMAALAESQADEIAKKRFSTLSEGQKQRVWLARALVGEPDLLVLDEPTSALDALAERHVFELLVDLIARRSLAVIQQVLDESSEDSRAA
ncbi:MAG TPA: ATP-binding cassette domain-containing protein, partial [Phenylobacterium sp.]|nr:ATP-binding cassette domain-containing protein [Phenylobacterium sp.]